MSIEVPVSEGDEVRSLSQEEPSLHFSIDAKGMRLAFIDGQVIMWPKEKTIDGAVVIGEQEGGLYNLKGHLEQALIHDLVEPNEL